MDSQVIPMLSGDATEQTPPDLPSYLFNERIVYIGAPLVPSVTELVLAELLYLQYQDSTKPVHLYINSTGTNKDGAKFAYDTEAFSIYDTMRYVKPPIHTLCIGTAFGEAAFLLSSGKPGMRAALPSSSIMLKQPIDKYQGQASDIEIKRRELRTIKSQMIDILSSTTGRDHATLEQDINRPRYLTPYEAVEFGVIDQVLEGKEGQAIQQTNEL
jgi:ATP-dependent Clp protease protease subunit